MPDNFTEFTSLHASFKKERIILKLNKLKTHFMINTNYASILTLKYYRFSEKRHNTMKQKTIRLFVTWCITYIRVTFQRSTFRSYSKLKLPNFEIFISQSQKILMFIKDTNFMLINTLRIEKMKRMNLVFTEISFFPQTRKSGNFRISSVIRKWLQLQYPVVRVYCDQFVWVWTLHFYLC